MLNPHSLLMIMAYLKFSSRTYLSIRNSTQFCILGHEYVRFLECVTLNHVLLISAVNNWIHLKLKGQAAHLFTDQSLMSVTSTDSCLLSTKSLRFISSACLCLMQPRAILLVLLCHPTNGKLHNEQRCSRYWCTLVLINLTSFVLNLLDTVVFIHYLI